MEKPVWPACERNREPLLNKLRNILPSGTQRIFEIGSGTGQHADWFTAHEPSWIWQTSDQAEYLPGIRAWQLAATRPNFPPPELLDVREPSHWAALREQSAVSWNWIYNANALHIMSWETVRAMFAALPEVMSNETGLLLYGPFNRGGQFTSASNAAFDASLRERDPNMGIRDLEVVHELALDIGLSAPTIHEMPANNLLLEFKPHPENRF